MTAIYCASYGLFQWKLKAMKPKSLLRDGNNKKFSVRNKQMEEDQKE